MVEENEVKVEVRILIEHRSRRQGGKLFRILIEEAELELPQRDAVRLAKSILKISKEK